jgi:hypothetical protein
VLANSTSKKRLIGKNTKKTFNSKKKKEILGLVIQLSVVHGLPSKHSILSLTPINKEKERERT